MHSWNGTQEFIYYLPSLLRLFQPRQMPTLIDEVRVEFLIRRCASQMFASPAKSCRPCTSSTGALIAFSFGRKSKFPSALRKAGTA